MGENTFEFRYSAAQQKEIEMIRNKYIQKQEDKMTLLRRMDASVTQKGMIASLTVGIVGALVMGAGMSLSLVWENMIVGIPIGLMGIVLLAFAYPIYRRIVQKERERIAPEILRLTEELMK